MQWRWQARLTSVLMALAFLTLFLAPAARAVDPASVTITPGEKAAWFDVQGAGFDRAEMVKLTVTGPSGQSMLLDERTSTADGYVAYLIRMPRHSEAGAWTLTLLGKDSGLTASGTLQMPLLGPDIDLIVSQAVVKPGTKLDFTASAFESNEVVGYWLTGPDGKIHINGSADATPTGRINFSTIIGETMPLGLWKMSAYGITSDHLGIAEFIVNLVGGSGPVPVPTTTATVTPGVTPGWFWVKASGFAHEEMVKFILTGPSGQTMGLAGHTTTADGTLDYQFRMPRYAEAGRWTIGLVGDTSERTSSAAFDMPNLGADLVLTVSDAIAAPGATITVTGDGFDPQETVECWLVGPDGKIYPSVDITATTKGHINLGMTLGQTAGQWKVYAYGKSSDHLGLAALTVK